MIHLALAVVLMLPGISSIEEQTDGLLAPEAYTADLLDDELKNGQLPESRLIEVDGCVLERDAAYTLSLMLEAADADGIRLDPAWCYRTLAEQQRTYDRNCPVIEVATPVIDPATNLPMVGQDGEPITTLSTRRECSLPTAAPSTSNHGWGRAADFAVRQRLMSCGDKAFSWLQDNAWRYGWVHPEWAACGEELEEPWHWEYGGLALFSRIIDDSLPIPPNAE